MKVIGVFFVCSLLLAGCSSYHIEQNSRNGLKCSEQDMRGNTIVNSKCNVHIEGKEQSSTDVVAK